jgi:hypothetical protein
MASTWPLMAIPPVIPGQTTPRQNCGSEWPQTPHIDDAFCFFAPNRRRLPSSNRCRQPATKVQTEAKSPHDNTIARGCDPKVLAKARTDVFDIAAPKP